VLFLVNLGQEGLTRLWNGKALDEEPTPELKQYLHQALEDEDLLFMDNVSAAQKKKKIRI